MLMDIEFDTPYTQRLSHQGMIKNIYINYFLMASKLFKVHRNHTVIRGKIYTFQ